MLQRERSSPGRWKPRLARTGIAVVFVASFVAAITTHAARQNLADPEFYRRSLDEAHAYDRAYDEVLFDPALSRQVGDLLGGVEIPTDEIKSVVQEIAPPGQLRFAVEDATDRLLSFMRTGDSLELAIDVTAFVQAIFEAVVGFTIQAVGDLPEQRTSSYREFLFQFQDTLETLDRGEIPEAIPAYQIPDDDVDAIANIVFEVGHIDPESELGESVHQAVAEDDVAGAIKVATASILIDHIAAAVDDLVRQLDSGPRGEILLAAPDDVTERVSDRLQLPRRVLDLAGAGRLVSAVLALAALAGLVAITWPDRRNALRWVGATLACAGLASAIFWIVARAYAIGRIEEVVARNTPGFPESFTRLVRDVLDEAASQLAPGFWIPALVAVAAGLGLVIASLILPRAGSATRPEV